MSLPEFALMVLAVAVITALPAWAWWAVADDDEPEVLPDPRLSAAIEATAGPSQFPTVHGRTARESTVSTGVPFPALG